MTLYFTVLRPYFALHCLSLGVPTSGWTSAVVATSAPYPSPYCRLAWKPFIYTAPTACFFFCPWVDGWLGDGRDTLVASNLHTLWIWRRRDMLSSPPRPPPLQQRRRWKTPLSRERQLIRHIVFLCHLSTTSLSTRKTWWSDRVAEWDGGNTCFSGRRTIKKKNNNFEKMLFFHSLHMLDQQDDFSFARRRGCVGGRNSTFILPQRRIFCLILILRMSWGRRQYKRGEEVSPDWMDIILNTAQYNNPFPVYVVWKMLLCNVYRYQLPLWLPLCWHKISPYWLRRRGQEKVQVFAK